MRLGTQADEQGLESPDRQQRLLDSDDEGLPAAFARRVRDNPRQFAVIGAICGAVLLVILYLSVQTLHPNEYGIVRNLITGGIAMDVYRGGVHLTGPTRKFITFPATQMTLEFSRKRHADRSAVQTRTGADRRSSSDPRDSEGGGQPITISCSIQYEFVMDNLTSVYLNFGSYEAARQRYILLAGNMVSNTAQDFTPQQFWTDRKAIAEEMLAQIKEVLLEDGNVNATRFQILNIDFADQFEDAITQVQVAEQQKVVNEYDQQVQAVEQSIDVLQAENQAHITAINAHADALGRQQIANATRDGFNMKQGMKAAKYAQLQKALGFDAAQMEQYFKIKSIQGQESKHGRTIVGVPPVVGPDAAPNRSNPLAPNRSNPLANT